MQTTTHRCGQCGTPLATNARFCINCGSAVAVETHTIALGERPVHVPERIPLTIQEERSYATYCHIATLLGWIIPFGDILLTFLLWYTWRDRSAFVDVHGREALNYQINFYIWTTFFALLACIYIGIPFLMLLALIDITIPVIAAVKAGRGEVFRYPAIIRLVK